MHIIIDGYNVLKQKYGNEPLSLQTRRAFIAMLGKYVEHKNHTIAVVFDGGDTVWPSQEKDHGIIIWYAGIKHTADDIIKKMLQQKPHVLVVTDDADLKASAHKVGATVVGALEFYSVVKDTVLPSTNKESSDMLIKTADQEDPFINMIMQEAARTAMARKEDIKSVDERTSKAHKAPKKERNRWQKIKKL